jgi:hypothetical protein
MTSKQRASDRHKQRQDPTGVGGPSGAAGGAVLVPPQTLAAAAASTMDSPTANNLLDDGPISASGRGGGGGSHHHAVGDRVCLRGLKNAAYNGKRGVDSLPSSNCNEEDRYGVLLEKTKKAVAIRREHVFAAAEEAAAVVDHAEKQQAKKSTQELKEERDKIGRVVTGSPEDEAMNKEEQMNLMRTARNLHASDEFQAAFGRKVVPIPDYVKEFQEAGALPLGVDPDWALDYLSMTFEIASTLPIDTEFYMKNQAYKVTMNDLIPRLGSNHPQKLDWYFGSRRPGDIFQGRITYPYPDCFRHSFSNQAYRPQILYKGTTHVAVGFVDLGILLAAELAESPPPSGPAGPMCFVGVERSAYAVI